MINRNKQKMINKNLKKINRLKIVSRNLEEDRVISNEVILYMLHFKMGLL